MRIVFFIFSVCFATHIQSQHVVYEEGSKWGFKDAAGNTLTEPIYEIKPGVYHWCSPDVDSTHVFYYVTREGKGTFLTHDLKMLLPIAYKMYSPQYYCKIYDPFFYAGKDKKMDIFSVKKRRIITNHEYSDLNPVFSNYNNNYAISPFFLAEKIINGQKKMGIVKIDSSENILQLIPVNNDAIHYKFDYEENAYSIFGDSIFVFYREKKSGAYNRDGRLIVPFDYDSVKIYENAYKLILKKDNKYTIADFSGNTNPQQFDYLSMKDEVIFIARSNGKYGIMDLYGKFIAPMLYDSIEISYLNHLKKGNEWFTFDDKGNKFSSQLKDVEQFEIFRGSSDIMYLFKQNGKWGALDSKGKLLFEPKFNEYAEVIKDNVKTGIIKFKNRSTGRSYLYDVSGQEIPDTANDIALMSRQARNLKADKVLLDGVNEDGLFIAKNKSSQKWGMYQDVTHGKKIEILEIIPPLYDNIEFFSFNGDFTAVYKEGKIGFYLSKLTSEKNARQSVECIYEDYKKFVYDFERTGYSTVTYLAVKNNGKWGWLNWRTGKEESEFIYTKAEDLPRPENPYKSK